MSVCKPHGTLAHLCLACAQDDADQLRRDLTTRDRELAEAREIIAKYQVDAAIGDRRLAAAQEEAKGLRTAHMEIVQRWQRAQWCVLCDHYVCTSDCPVSISARAIVASGTCACKACIPACQRQRAALDNELCAPCANDHPEWAGGSGGTPPRKDG